MSSNNRIARVERRLSFRFPNIQIDFFVLFFEMTNEQALCRLFRNSSEEFAEVCGMLEKRGGRGEEVKNLTRTIGKLLISKAP